MPHLALPALTGFLRQRGYDVTQRDLNLEVMDEVLTRRHVRDSMERIRSRFGPGASQRPLAYGRPKPEDVEWALRSGPALADQIEDAKAILRSPQFYDGETSEPAYLIIAQALELTSLAHYPARLELTTFIDAGRTDSSQDLFKAARDPNINPFYEIFRRGILKDLQRDQPDLIGISIPTSSQLLAGLTLAAMVRDAGLKCHIVVGGPHVTMMRERLVEVPRIFDLIDSAVLFEGEIPLLRLLEALQAGGDLSGVPNLVYRLPGSDMKVVTNPEPDFKDARSIEEQQQPDFEGLPLERYLAPELVLPLATTHGCYYGKCAFCNVGYGSPTGYFPLPVAHILSQVQTLQEKYGVRNIFFVDEAITPRIMRQLSAALIERDSPINWTVAARFEKSLTDELLVEAAKSGCRMLLYGLESASEPIMLKMVKGTQVQEMSRILHTATGVGIWNHTFFFFGFPGETINEAQETVNFIYANQDVIHSASPGAFLLEIYSPAYNDPAKYGISRVITDPERDLAIYFDFELVSGMSEAEANDLADRFVEQLPNKRFGQFYMNDVVRFLYACEINRREQLLPRWIE